jgi:predicted nucleotidyltransferase
METFGEKIRKLRMEKNLPLRVVAAHLDIDQAILSKIERGIKRASREQVVKISAFFNAGQDELLVAWLAEKLVHEVQDEKIGMEALKVAEAQVLYNTSSVQEKKSLIKIIIDYLKSDGRVAKAYLFGSFARGEEKAASDIDIMVTFSEKASGTLLDYADLKFNLENLLNRKVDIVEEGYVQPFALPSINRDKIKIYG